MPPEQCCLLQGIAQHGCVWLQVPAAITGCLGPSSPDKHTSFLFCFAHFLVAAGAAEGQEELESCHGCLPSQAGSCSVPSQGRGEQRAQEDSSSYFENHWDGNGHAEQSCSPEGWGQACTRKSGLGSLKRCVSMVGPAEKGVRG